MLLTLLNYPLFFIACIYFRVLYDSLFYIIVPDVYLGYKNVLENRNRDNYINKTTAQNIAQ